MNLGIHNTARKECQQILTLNLFQGGVRLSAEVCCVTLRLSAPFPSEHGASCQNPSGRKEIARMNSSDSNAILLDEQPQCSHNGHSTTTPDATMRISREADGVALALALCGLLGAVCILAGTQS